MIDLTQTPERYLGDFQNEIYSRIVNSVYVENPYNLPIEGISWLSYTKFISNPTLNLLLLADMKVTPEMAKDGMIEVSGRTKKGFNDKRVKMKIGRYFSRDFPFLDDHVKESIVQWIISEYTEAEGEYSEHENGFEVLVTMKRGACGGSVSNGYKLLSNSCMRYKAERLGVTTHPYAAYESGEFLMAVIIADGRLQARTIIHKETKTHSAIYCSRTSFGNLILKHLEEKGYKKVCHTGWEWERAKLLHIADFYTGEDYDHTHVVLAPYIDYFSTDTDGYGYSDGEFIYLAYKEGCEEIYLRNGEGLHGLEEY